MSGTHRGDFFGIPATGKHVTRDGHTIAVTLAANPSHLETVDPKPTLQKVMLGRFAQCEEIGNVAAFLVRAKDVSSIGRPEGVGRIEAQRVIRRDQGRKDRHNAEQEHESDADGAEGFALKEAENSPSGAGAGQRLDRGDFEGLAGEGHWPNLIRGSIHP